MAGEREKLRRLTLLYQLARQLLPGLGVSQQNLLYFASLVNFYAVYDLRNLKKEQTWLYLLCYIWFRYRQLSDNLVSAGRWHMKQTEDRCKEDAKKVFEADQLQRQQESHKVERLLSLFVDDAVTDATAFGDVRQRAWKIMPRNTLQSTALRMLVRPVSRMGRRWEAVDIQAAHIRRHLHPLCCALNFSSRMPECHWLAALIWVNDPFLGQPRMGPQGNLPARLLPWLLIADEKTRRQYSMPIVMNSGCTGK